MASSEPCFFVTGATGAVGSAVIPRLLQDPSARVELLVRAKSQAALAQRLESLHSFWGLAPDDERRNRVAGQRGDVTLPKFGLEDHAQQRLAEQCTHIIHTAGIVRMNLPIDDARRSAVSAARHLVGLAQGCRQLEKIEFVSTVGVGGRRRRVSEAWIDQARSFHNTYEQAKAEAEDLIRGEVEQGLPLTVHRPSMVVGDSGTGQIMHFQVFYHLCEFLSGRRTFGLSPRFGQARLDIIPVDIVAAAIAWSSRQPALAGQILHLCSGPEEATPLIELRCEVRRAFSARGIEVPAMLDLPSGLFTPMINLASWLMDEKTRRAVSTLPVFLEYLASDQRFENKATRQLLKQVGITIPPWRGYLETVLSAYLNTSTASSR